MFSISEIENTANQNTRKPLYIQQYLIHQAPPPLLTACHIDLAGSV